MSPFPAARIHKGYCLPFVEMSGVKHHAEMQVTTVDSPNLMKFVRTNYPQSPFELAQTEYAPTNFEEENVADTTSKVLLCVPKKNKRGGTCTCLGIRKAESSRRAKRHNVEVFGQRIGYEIHDGQLHTIKGGEQLFETDTKTKIYCVNGKDKVVISPIFEWSDKDVWDFIKGNNMPYCDLYDMGFHRIGCMFCPMASVKEKRKGLELFPRFAEKVYIRAIRELMAQTGNYSNFDSPEQVFEWWISNENAADWLSNKRNQQNLFNYDNHKTF